MNFSVVPDSWKDTDHKDIKDNTLACNDGQIQALKSDIDCLQFTPGSWGPEYWYGGFMLVFIRMD